MALFPAVPLLIECTRLATEYHRCLINRHALRLRQTRQGCNGLQTYSSFSYENIAVFSFLPLNFIDPLKRAGRRIHTFRRFTDSKQSSSRTLLQQRAMLRSFDARHDITNSLKCQDYTLLTSSPIRFQWRCQLRPRTTIDSRLTVSGFFQ